MRGVGSVVAVPEWSDEEIERGRAKERERAEAREEARLENEAPDRLSDFDNSDGELDEEEQVHYRDDLTENNLISHPCHRIP